MTKKQLLALLPKRKQLAAMHKRLVKQEQALHKKAVRIWLALEELRDIEIIEGEPCKVWQPSAESTRWSHATAGRRAEVYLNQHNRTTWGCTISGEGVPNAFQEKWLGADFAKDAADRLAKDWVLHGKLPTIK